MGGWMDDWMLQTRTCQRSPTPTSYLADTLPLYGGGCSCISKMLHHQVTTHQLYVRPSAYHYSSAGDCCSALAVM